MRLFRWFKKRPEPKNKLRRIPLNKGGYPSGVKTVDKLTPPRNK